MKKMKELKWVGFSKNATWFSITIAIMIVIGGLFRIMSCYWGYPVPLHVDEPTIVEKTIDMLSRHSWNAYVYNRPDQFEIKCNAFLFTVVSWIKYHVPAYVAFKAHEMTFYLTARLYTALLGTALIPLASMLIGKVAGPMPVQTKIAQISGAFIVAFSTIFIKYSAYATPDIPLTFFIAVFTYLFLSYLETGEDKTFVWSCVVIGIGITIKYPAAVLCIPLAFMVVYRAVIIDSKPSVIVKLALKSILFICLTIFIVAPNLYTDAGKVYTTLLREARSTHLGRDGLGFTGNFLYYARTAMDNLGWESVALACIGIFSVIKTNLKQKYFIVTGVVFWICISILPLHWERWGVPIYFFYNLTVAIGIGFVANYYVSDNIKGSMVSKNTGGIIFYGLAFLLSVLMLFNIFISGCAVTKYNLLTDTRISAKMYCDRNGITKNNTLYEIATPFAPKSGIYNLIVRSFNLEKSGIKIKKEYMHKKYLMFNNTFRERYLKEPARYKKEIAVFEGINKQYKLLHKEIPDGNYEQQSEILRNIKCSLQYLCSYYKTSGSMIFIYQLF